MTDRKEALEFLELTDLATPQEIKAKLASKLTYFETLCEKAPSQFVRRLHQRNVERVKEIVQAAKTWEGMGEPEAAAPVATTPVAAEQAVPEPAAVAEPAAAAKAKITAKAVEPVVAEPAAEPRPIAWLVRHTENQSTTSYPLYAGKTYIGRKEKPGLQPFVRIGDDPYISKFHAVIIAESGNPTTFYLADDAAAKGEKPSTNGTYLNGREGRVTAKTQVKNNDTIQLGITKLVFRVNDADVQTIIKDVEKKNYMHTVIIDIK